MLSNREVQIEQERQKICSLFDSDAHEVAVVLDTGAFYIVYEYDYEEVFDSLKHNVKAVHRVS